MPTRLNPYLSFQGQAKEAMEFYKSVFGGTLTMTAYKDGGMPHDPTEADKTMHALLEAENGIVIMAADTPNSMQHSEGSSISISLSGENDSELSGYFEKLSVGGSIDQPLVAAPWGDKFGMLTDKFGTHWMVNITAAKA